MNIRNLSIGNHWSSFPCIMCPLLLILILVDLGATTMKIKIRHRSELSRATKLIEKLGPFKQQIYCPNNYTKMKCKPLSTEQGYMSTPQNAQGRRRKQNVSSRQEFQDELGYLLLSLLRCYSDDEREKHLRFIEWTLRRYIQLVERSWVSGETNILSVSL